MHTRPPNRHDAAFSLLEWILVLGILSLAAFTILPSFRKTRDAIAIERTVRCLEKCETAIHFILNTRPDATNRLAVTLSMIDDAFGDTNLSHRVSPPAWPPQADLATFRPQKDSPTVDVRLRSGVTTVSTEDGATPR